MNSLLLAAIIFAFVAVAAFVIFVSVGAAASARQNEESIKRLEESVEKMKEDFAHIDEFADASTEAFVSIGQVIDEINSKTRWLDGLDAEILSMIGQNKDKGKS